MKSSAAKIKMESFDSLFGGEKQQGEQVTEIPLKELHAFKDHPFRVMDDEKMQETVESIREHGIICPLIVRPGKKEGYEIISGHRRKRACELLGIKTVPCFIRDMTDEEATVTMVDSNIQREELLYSEKAYAYKMKLDALNKQGRRTDLTSDQVGQKLPEKTSREMLADSSNDSSTQIQRYVRLTYLIKPLLDYIDEKRIAFGVGVELSYLELTEQERLYQSIKRLCVFPNLAQARKLKELSKERKLDENGMEIVLSGEKPAAPTVKLQRKRLNEYFPEDYSAKQMEEVIYELLKRWSFEQGNSKTG